MGFQVLLGCCAQTAVHAGSPSIPGYYGNVSSILPPSATALPTSATLVSGISGIDTTGNSMTVRQKEPNAVIHWGSFDIGSDASVTFDQPNSSSKVLNRVMGDNPSQIYGKLNANGRVYILNQNGILFGPGSKVNVHSLTASALNLKDEDFLATSDYLNDGEQYTHESWLPDVEHAPSNATVSNHGSIIADNYGAVFLIGANVENNGLIDTPNGFAGLFSTENLTITQNINTDSSGTTPTSLLFNNTNSQGYATNFTEGSIIADSGEVNFYGKAINQEGLIRATTALQKNGKIALKATEIVRTSENSKTVTPISSSNERFSIVEADFKRGEITLESDGTIEHYGTISNPSGTVSMTAKNRVFLENGSSIDVSGSWVALTAADRTIDIQLNSAELRDAFIYKDGPLKGETITVDIVTGLTVGNAPIDISGYLSSMKKSVAEMTTSGGSINLSAHGSNGEVIVKNGASLDFSGGGLIYGDGLIASTKVRVGNKIYDLMDVPSGMTIDAVLNSYSKENARYNLTDTWDGIYYGGSSSYLGYLSAFKQGANGGSCSIVSRKFILDGTMNAAVERGIYQTLLEEPTDSNGNIAALGRKIPISGNLIIGQSEVAGESTYNFTTDSINISNETTKYSITSNELLPDYTDAVRISEISAQSVNSSGIGTLKLYANTAITIEQDTNLTLADLGEIDLTSRNIEHHGSIYIPSGKVNFSLYKTVNSVTADEINTITLDKESIIDVSGNQLDYLTDISSNSQKFGFTFGGSVSLTDENKINDSNIIISDGSIINVNGGFSIYGKNTISGANAGEISITANNIQLDGTISGLALEGSNGGKIALHTDNISVTSASTVSSDLTNPSTEFTLADNRFAKTGFTTIILESEGDLNVASGVNLTPSSERLATPFISSSGYQWDDNTTAILYPANFGTSSITLNAGPGYELHAGFNSLGSVTIDEDASLSVSPKDGSISLAGYSVSLGGTLQAQGGTVSITANTINSENSQEGEGKLTLLSTAIVDVSGTTFVDWDSSLFGFPVNYLSVGGGSVSLTGRDIILKPGSTVDVSGSNPITNRSIDGQGNIIVTTEAASAGNVSVTFQNSYDFEGTFKGDSKLAWLTGGIFTLTNNENESSGTNTTLAIREENVTDWTNHGFDNLIFSSKRAIIFEESPKDNDTIVNIAPSRGLTINGSRLEGSGSQQIYLSAPWLQLSNIDFGTITDKNNDRLAKPISVTEGQGQITLAGDFIDIRGNIVLSGFSTSTIASVNDLRLYDYFYNNNNSFTWSGGIYTAGDIILQASAIYPSMHHNPEESDSSPTSYPSQFIISSGLLDKYYKISDNNGGEITILSPNKSSSSSIYSAGGKLLLQSESINNYGVLVAPLGNISLEASDNINLYPGSVISTSGASKVFYGKYYNKQWTAGGFTNTNDSIEATQTLTSAPIKSVTLDANEIVQSEGAVISVEGGGTILAYQFLPGYTGTNNPLVKSNRYVILPDNSVLLPGNTIYLEGSPTLSAGTYSLLPVEYAFLPGAIIIEATDSAILPGQTLKNPSGYTVVAGYMSDRSITSDSPLREGYIIRAAGDVLTEGNFDISEYVAGDAGTVTINAGAGTSMLSGSIRAQALSGYNGGVLTLGAQDIFVGNLNSLTEDTLKTYTPYTSEEINLVFDIEKLRNQGLRKLTLGVTSNTENTTNTIIIGKDSTLEGISAITMDATDTILFDQGAKVIALATDDSVGKLSLNTGALIARDGTMLRAANALTLKVDNLGNESTGAFNGTIQVDQGTFTLYSSDIYIESIGFTGSKNNSGAYLSTSSQQSFLNIDDVELHSTGKNGDTTLANITFLGDVNLKAKGDLVLDGARIAVDAPSTASISVTAGGMLTLENTSSASSTSSDSSGHTINIKANSLVFDGIADLQFDTFDHIDFTSKDETIFKGTSSLITDLAVSQQISFTASHYIAAVTKSETQTLTLSDFTINAGVGNVQMKGYDLVDYDAKAIPGSLTVTANNITLDDAYFDMPGGNLSFEATNSITVTNSHILARGNTLNIPITINGTEYENTISLAGGDISMVAATGTLTIDTQSTIDTSANSGLEGGRVNLAAAVGGVTIAGSIQGDKLSYDSHDISEFSTLINTITAGGFRQLIDLTARTGDVFMSAESTITTSQFALTADQGAVKIAGTIDAAGSDGGSVEIWADKELSLTGKIFSVATDIEGDGGEVLLASATSGVVTDKDSLINVAGGTNGTQGSASLRASRDAIIDGKMDVDGDIQGAAHAIVRAFKVYTDTEITSDDVTGYKDDINTAWSGLQAKKSSWLFEDIDIAPEVEVRSEDNDHLTITSGLNDLHSLTTQIAGVTPGVFTFRAAGDLTVSSNIIDAPTDHLTDLSPSKPIYIPVIDQNRDSWDLNFIAGANLKSARLFSTKKGIGDFIIGSSGVGKLIYAESGSINFSSGKDTIINTWSSSNINSTPLPALYMPGTMRYNLASFDGNINGEVGNDLVLDGGVIQTAVSDISINVGNDIQLNGYQTTKSSVTWYGGIRTTGASPASQSQNAADTATTTSLKQFWTYTDGGNISVAAEGDIITKQELGGFAWDSAYTYKVNNTTTYEYGATFDYLTISSTIATNGITTMAGGDITILADDVDCQAGIFGNGTLKTYASGSLSGRFLATEGDITLRSLTDFGSTGAVFGGKTLVELGSGNLLIEALGNVELETIHDPIFSKLTKDWKFSYTEKSSAIIHSILGDVVFTGWTDKEDGWMTATERDFLLPAYLTIRAGEDISITNKYNTAYIIAPSIYGQHLNLIAGNDISGKYVDTYTNSYRNSSLYMSIANPEDIYNIKKTPSAGNILSILQNGPNTTVDYKQQTNDPAKIYAGNDINNLTLLISKKSDIYANNDIIEISYKGQNLNETDISVIKANNDIILESYKGKYSATSSIANGATNDFGIEQAGSGIILIQSGNNIDLGGSSGIISTGKKIYSIDNISLIGESDQYNNYEGSDIVVLAGYNTNIITEKDVDEFKTKLNNIANTEKEKDIDAYKFDKFIFDEISNYLNSIITSERFDQSTNLSNTLNFFQSLYSCSTEYNKNQENKDTISRYKKLIVEFIISSIFTDTEKRSNTGNISMINSSITTTSGQDNIYIASLGNIDIGISSIDTLSSQKGIITQSGGNINIYSNNDIDINQSRIVTYFGGDIFLLSNHGDINAGIGSKTVLSPSTRQANNIGGIYYLKNTAPAVGSGVRALTVDPDGIGPLLAPGINAQGENEQQIVSIAWEGIIDAGEAGISAANVSLAAQQILHVENISFTGTAVGVPSTNSAGPSLSALAGSTTVSDTQSATQSIGQQVTDSGKKLAESVSKMAEDLTIKMLVFKFEGFGGDSGSTTE